MSTSGGRCDNCGRTMCACAPGEPGEPGDDGEPGAPGQKGEKGDQGGQGDPGGPGQPGRDGNDGDDGEPGPPGRDGAQGSTGPASAPGLDGIEAQDGEPGPPGQKGDRGIQGLPGRDGNDGDDGEPGPPGVGFGPIRNGRIMGTDTVTSGFPRPLTGAEVLADLSAQAAGAFNWNAKELTNLGVPGSGNSAATRDYVDNAPGRILATTQYAPAAITTYTVAATTLTLLDATNLTLAFTFPTSGRVDVNVNFYCLAIQTATICQLFAGLLNHTGGAVVGFPTLAIQTQSAALSPLSVPASPKFELSGTPGAALQVDLAAGRTNAVGCVGQIYAGGAASTNVATLAAVVGPIIMQAVASI